MARINMELCNSTRSIKYICKYVKKESGQAAFSLENEWDEVTNLLGESYVSTFMKDIRLSCTSLSMSKTVNEFILQPLMLHIKYKTVQKPLL